MSYAKQLAKKGLNVILISRTPSKLDAVAAEIGKQKKMMTVNRRWTTNLIFACFFISIFRCIESKYRVRTKVIAVDFTHNDIYKKIADEIKELDIGVLVNNIGICYDYPEYFLNVSNGDTTFDNIIRGNIYAIVFMTKIILPRMLKKSKGIVINFSSISATFPTPFLAVYSASKVYYNKSL